jgi:hypothetical protein
VGLSSKLVAGGIVAGAAVAYYLQRRKARTGESYVRILLALPGDVQRWATDAQQRATLALEEGKSAARQRDAELSEQLATAETAPHPAGG